MKFIFPQNYSFKNKILGIIDYSTAFLNILWYVFVFCLLHLLIHNWNVKIFLFISFCFPLTIFSIVGFNGEPVMYVLKYILKYIIRPKLYLYKKY